MSRAAFEARLSPGDHVSRDWNARERSMDVAGAQELFRSLVWQHNKQIQIAIWAVIASRYRAEQANLLGMIERPAA